MGSVHRLFLSLYGWLMAYLLPGVGCLYALTYWSDYIRKTFDSFIGLASNSSLLVVTLLASLILGKLISAFSALVFEGWLCKGYRMDILDVADIKDLENRELYRTMLDENFRYYQCLGGFAFVLPFLFGSWLWHMGSWLSSFEKFAITQAFLICEFVVIRIALITYRNCATYLSRLLQNEARDNQKDAVVSHYEVRSKKGISS